MCWSYTRCSNPAGYVLARASPGSGGNSPQPTPTAPWISFTGIRWPLQAIATARPASEGSVSGTDTDRTAEYPEADAPASELPEVLVSQGQSRIRSSSSSRGAHCR